MSIIPRTPGDVWSCKLLSTLKERSTPEDDAAGKAAALIETAAPLTDLTIAGPFKHFTLHNRDHSKKILHLSTFLVAEETLTHLSVLDILVIVYAAYLHDLGMALTETERERIVESPEFSELVQGWDELWEALSEARGRLQSAKEDEKFAIEAEIFQLQEAALTVYLRRRHASPNTYRTLIESLKQQTNRRDLFEFKGVSFEDLLVEVCASHNLDVGALAEVRGPHEERFPRKFAAGSVYLNAQFCAAILRLSDIMDFDRERTPRVLFESLGLQTRSLPGAEISLSEWEKHMAVHSLEINPDEIVVSAECHHPVIEKTIREFCQLIEREIRDTLAVLRRNPSDIAEHYQIELPISVRPSIRPVGYVYKDMSLSLNQPRIVSLLMGERLYSTPAVAIRELLQNSIDACALRLQMDGESYKPEISVAVDVDSHGRRWIEVRDNGNGMDEHVLSEYFLKLGSSYYNSRDLSGILRSAKRGQPPFTPISRFGIGLVSAFLVCDLLEVDTRCIHSSRGDHQGRSLSIEKLGALVFLTEQDSAHDGTLMRLRLLSKLNDNFDEFATQVCNYLKAKIVRPRFGIDIRLLDVPFRLESRNGIVQRKDAREILDAKGVEMVLLDISRWSDRFSGQMAILFVKTADGRLSHLRGSEYLRTGNRGIDPTSFLIDFPGNRVTVNGFTMNLRKIGKALGGGKNRLAVLLDIDIRGDETVQYDISRDRIVGAGAIAVKSSLRDAVLHGLRDTGALERLEPETRRIVESTFEDPAIPTGFQPDEELLKRVALLVPDGVWTKGLHRKIALQLDIRPGLVWKVLAALNVSGRVALQEAATADDRRLGND